MGEEIGKHQVMAAVPGSLQSGQPSARRNPGAGGKHGVIPIMFFLSKLLVFKCQVPNPLLPPHTLVPHLLLLTEMCL